MIYKNIQFTIPRNEVLLRLKYNVQKSEMSDSVEKLIDAMTDEAYVLAEAEASVEHFLIKEITNASVILEGTDFQLRSTSLVKHLKDCYQVSLFVCTIGSEYSERIKTYLDEKEIAKATVLDAVCSEAIEAVTEKINAMIRQEAEAAGATTVSRFSTGYGDWEVSSQKELCALLEGNEIGITVNDSNLMIPEKSVSACVGWKKIDRPARKILDQG